MHNVCDARKLSFAPSGMLLGGRYLYLCGLKWPWRSGDGEANNFDVRSEEFGREQFVGWNSLPRKVKAGDAAG